MGRVLRLSKPGVAIHREEPLHQSRKKNAERLVISGNSLKNEGTLGHLWRIRSKTRVLMGHLWRITLKTRFCLLVLGLTPLLSAGLGRSRPDHTRNVPSRDERQTGDKAPPHSSTSPSPNEPGFSDDGRAACEPRILPFAGYGHECFDECNSLQRP